MQEPRQGRLFQILAVFLLCLPSALHAETGVSDTRILLGQSAGLSGPTAQLSRQMFIGAKVYFDKVNSQGGVHGRRIELITRDDQYLASLAAYNTRHLIERDQVFALFGFVGWRCSDAAIPIATTARVPFFAPMSGGTSIHTPLNRYVFTVRASYAQEHAHLLRRLSSMGIRKLALAYPQNYYGDLIRRDLEQLARRESLELNSIDIDASGMNLDSAAEQILATRSDVVMLVGRNYQTSARLVRALRSKGFLGQFSGMSFVGQKALADELGDLARGMLVTQVVPFPWRISMPLVAEYRNRMAEAGYAHLTFGSLEGYIAARVLVEGLRRAQRDLTREKLIRALESINPGNYDGGGYGINFSADNHNASHYVDMATMTKDALFLN